MKIQIKRLQHRYVDVLNSTIKWDISAGSLINIFHHEEF